MFNSDVSLGESFLFLFLFFLLWYTISQYNSTVTLRNMLSEAKSNIDIVKVKKYTLMKKLIEIASQYGGQEMGVMKSIANAFSGNTVNAQQAVARLASLRMTFPNIKTNELYEEIFSELSLVEKEIAKNKEKYNAVALSYNTRLSTFPNNVLLCLFGFKMAVYWDFKLEGVKK